MIDPRRPIPANGYDRLRQNLESGFAEGFPVEKFPNPDNRANINRGTITSRKDDTVQDISIGLEDHDEVPNAFLTSSLVNGFPVVIPDFITLSYTCTIWCDYISQMNKLIESINYSSDSYWGDKEKFKFNSKIDQFNNTTELTIGDNRVVKTTFDLKLQGYLVPDSINKELTQQPSKFFSKSSVKFNGELSILPTGKPLTREEVRKALGTQNIEHLIDGLGLEDIIIDGGYIINP